MADKEYIEREAALALAESEEYLTPDGDEIYHEYIPVSAVKSIPAADVLPRDEAITIGAELAAMHGSDATSQQLEEAYLKGVDDGMTRRDVRPVVRGKWEVGGMFDDIGRCSCCNYMFPLDTAMTEFHFCPNCGADMRPTSVSGAKADMREES